MQIYVGKNGQQLGPFSLEEVNRKLADRTFVGADLAWYEGAAGWAPLSGVAGVVIPPVSTPTPVPAAAPIAVPSQPAPTVAPVRPNPSIVQPAPRGTGTLSMVTWILLGLTFIISFIPFVGCAAWALGVPIALTAIILGIVMMTRGGTGSGILAIIGGVLIVPLCFLAQFLSLMVFGGTVERKELSDIKGNLILIDSAKTKWATETKATDGTPVTMASLKSQLGGKEVKPAVDETYDPMPVGQAPTATLPANKTLGTFSGGDVMTVASIETALANTSAFSWNLKKSTTTTASPTPRSISPTPKPSVVPSAAPSTTPSETASPKPSLSPRSSATPHSLISPRQREETEESPSSRPSPSAKFAPPHKRSDTNPRQSPSETAPADGLRHGKQKPGESPAETPETKPDDDN
ncbi:MAG TPA: GYF domain-containing protein [Chthoniobacterales bacterium]|nr:GYF domain-containing protein [Chthoniobacterales bacterium]